MKTASAPSYHSGSKTLYALAVLVLAAAGWAVAPGRRFRIAAPPGVRISFARLAEPDAPAFAAEFARVLRHRASRLD